MENKTDANTTEENQIKEESDQLTDCAENKHVQFDVHGDTDEGIEEIHLAKDGKDTRKTEDSKKKLRVVGIRHGFVIMRRPTTEVEKQNSFALRKKTFEELHEEKQRVLGRKTMRKQEHEAREGLRRTSARYMASTRRLATGVINSKIVLVSIEEDEFDVIHHQVQKQNKPRKHKPNKQVKKKKKKGADVLVIEANSKLLDQLADFKVSHNSLNCVRYLGCGRFGAIQLAQEIYEDISGDSEETPAVAVKKFEVSTEKNDYHDVKHFFLRELVMLSKLKDQPYFLKFLSYSEEEEHVPMCASFEYMSGGSLHAFLSSGSVGIGEKSTQLKDRYHQPRVTHPTATLDQLLQIASDIALGMNYLSSVKILHRNLCASNVLLDGNLAGKITGFEFAVDEAEESPIQDFRIEKRSTIRWISVETLVDGISTTKSDVWSFGILLWEIVTLGCKPYPGLKAMSITKYLELGYRLNRPGDCSMRLYNLMLKCWDTNAVERPSFEEISESLDDLERVQNC